MAGQQVACPHCGGVMIVPAAPVQPTMPTPVQPASSQPPRVSPGPAAPVVPTTPSPVQPTPRQPLAQPGSRPVPITPGGNQTTPIRPVAVSAVSDGAVRVREPVQTVSAGDDEIDLRSLTSEEKSRRRMIKNLVLWTAGIILIALTMIVLLMLGPISPGS